MPVLVDGDGAPIFESAAILRYLADRYGDDNFWPEDAVNRAQIDKWAEWAKWNVGHAFIVNVFYGLVRTPADKIDHNAIKLAIGDLEKVLHWLIKNLQQALLSPAHNSHLLILRLGIVCTVITILMPRGLNYLICVVIIIC